MAYATIDDLLARYDAGLISDLASDGGDAEANLTASPRLSAALAGASGSVNSAALVGGRYTVEDLQGLAGDDREYLRDITCRLALLRLAGARITTIGEEVYKTLREETRAELDALKRGDRIFGTPGTSASQTPDTGGLTAIGYERLNLLPDRSRPYYPSRASRLPVGRQ